MVFIVKPVFKCHFETKGSSSVNKGQPIRNLQLFIRNKHPVNKGHL